jgi:hypothetical protein
METKDYDLLDEATAPLHALTRAIAGVQGRVQDEADVASWSIAAVHLELPLELDVHVGADGQLVLGSTPPHVSMDSSFPSVYHTIRVTLAAEDEPSDAIYETSIDEPLDESPAE